MADVVNPVARPPESTIRQGLGRFCITRIAIGIFVQFGRVPGALFAADVIANLALLRAWRELRSAYMASAMDALANRPLDQVLTSCARELRQGMDRIAGVLKIRRHSELPRVSGTQFVETGLVDVRLAFCMSGWEAWTFRAACVRAVDADLLGAEGGFAAVAGTADSHSDWLCDPLELGVSWGIPCAWIESEPVFGEESAGLRTMYSTVVGHDHWLRFNRLLGWGSCWDWN